MSHGVQLVELHGTGRGDKTLKGCHDPSCGRLCNMSLQQNSYLSQSETTTKILCALAQKKTRWLPSVHVIVTSAIPQNRLDLTPPQHPGSKAHLDTSTWVRRAFKNIVPDYQTLRYCQVSVCRNPDNGFERI